MWRPPSTDPRIGTVVPPYHIIELIDSGGFASVYRARDQGNDREVALKVLDSESCSHEGRARLEREAQVLRGIDHPHLVKVLDLVVSDEICLLAMELLKGRTLHAALVEQPIFSLRRVKQIARQIASGIGEAHRHGFVHRDLKPPNIMLVGEGANESVKLLDFGVAKTMIGHEHQRLTQPGFVLGSPRWMAPEQILDRPDVGPAADLYALGALMYRMISGRPVFEGQLLDVFEQHLTRKPQPLTEAGLLWPLIEALLAKAPAARPESAESVVEWLDRIDLERTVIVRMPSEQDLTPPPRKTPAPALVPKRADPPLPRRLGTVRATLLGMMWLLAIVVGLAIGGGFQGNASPPVTAPPAIAEPAPAPVPGLAPSPRSVSPAPPASAPKRVTGSQKGPEKGSKRGASRR